MPFITPAMAQKKTYDVIVVALAPPAAKLLIP